MCTQTWIVYKCGCKNKGGFEQCDRLCDLKSQPQCAITAQKDSFARNYCPEHMPKEDKALDEYRGRHTVERGKFFTLLLERQC